MLCGFTASTTTAVPGGGGGTFADGALVGSARANLVRAGISLVFALIAGAGTASQWNSWILFRNRIDFGVDDPQFGMDVGFYVFQLPFLSFLTSWLFAAFIIILIVTAAALLIASSRLALSPGAVK